MERKDRVASSLWEHPQGGIEAGERGEESKVALIGPGVVRSGPANQNCTSQGLTQDYVSKLTTPTS